ncbi:MAG: ABC transporter substrate-binding protein, partial [Candidatus Methylomirabilaceae bacterium]
QVGCYMLFVNGPIRGVRDLRGRTIASAPPGSGDYLFLASLLAYVGLDPRKDVNIVSHPGPQATQLFTEGKLDAYTVFSGTPPVAQELMKKKIGRVLVNTMTDRPWSQYFCCMTASNRDFVRRNPIATKRALRAMLKSTDVIAREPARVAKFLVAKGYTDRYDYALQILREIPFDKWREYEHEDTVRFFALRLREVEMIRKTPLQIITEGTDWRFLKELKREMKG